MAVEIITKQDLVQFKTELLDELKEIITSGESSQPPKKWLKSYEVKKMLGISPGTLQNLRINGTLSYTKIGGLIFYSYDDIVKLMEGKKKPPKR
jgi:hypothetical protein